MLKQLVTGLINSYRKADSNLIKFSEASYLSNHYSYAVSQPASLETSNNSVQIFTHVPKTAGTTLDWITKALCVYFDLSMYRVRGGLDPSNLSWEEDCALSELTSFPSDQLQTMDFISGHLPFGIHAQIKRESTYITLLREPVPHCISYYNFLVMRNVIKPKEKLSTLLKHKLIVDNPQTRQISGLSNATERCDEYVLAQAKENLDKFYSAVGVTELFNEFVALWLSLNGWPGVAYPHVQITGKKSISTTPKSLVALIDEYNKYDVELYAYALSNFKETYSRYSALPKPDNSTESKVIVIPLDFSHSNHITVYEKQTFEENKTSVIKEFSTVAARIGM